MTPLALMVDLSSNNPAPDLAQHYRARYRVLCLKVTEGTSYAWDQSHHLAAWWHSLGADTSVWHYHFLHPGTAASGAAQADWFWSHVARDLRSGDRVVCDCETQGETGSEVGAFWARYISHDLHTPRLDYGGPYFFRDAGIRPRHGEALWLADYSTQPAFIPPGWATWLAWQHTDRARSIPGIFGAVDLSHLSPAALPVYPKPTPPPAAAEDDMRLYIIVGTKPVWATNGIHRRWVQNQAELTQYERDFGVKAIALPKGSTFLDDIPVVGPMPK